MNQLYVAILFDYYFQSMTTFEVANILVIRTKWRGDIIYIY